MAKNKIILNRHVGMLSRYSSLKDHLGSAHLAAALVVVETLGDQFVVTINVESANNCTTVQNVIFTPVDDGYKTIRDAVAALNIAGPGVEVDGLGMLHANGLYTLRKTVLGDTVP